MSLSDILDKEIGLSEQFFCYLKSGDDGLSYIHATKIAIQNIMKQTKNKPWMSYHVGFYFLNQF